jgi:hypothetical protein
MAKWLSCSTGQTSWRRVPLALLASPAPLMIPLMIMQLFFFNVGNLEGGYLTHSFHNQIQELGITVVGLVGPTFVLGLPTWILLRYKRCESGLTYALAGLAEGLFCAFHFGYSGTGGLRLDQALGFGLLSLIGGAVAGLFWSLARDRTLEGIAKNDESSCL